MPSTRSLGKVASVNDSCVDLLLEIAFCSWQSSVSVVMAIIENVTEMI